MEQMEQMELQVHKSVDLQVQTGPTELMVLQVQRERRDHKVLVIW